MKEFISLRINGETHEVVTEPNRTLLEVLREDLGFYGTKQACDMGTCGACTVLLNNRPALACLLLAVACRDKEIVTIEGLRKKGELHPLQKSFIEKGAVQCGMCTPGMILSAKALLDETPHPTEAEVRLAISGNLCRCTGYSKIVEAILAASKSNDDSHENRG